MSSIDIARVTALIEGVAAEVVMPRFRSADRFAAIEKTGPADVVTQADLDAERLLTPALAAMLPGSRVVGEEACSENPEVMRAIAGDAPVWIIDPVDGTLNFAAGLPLFGVMVALVRGGETLAGWIHDPVAGWTAQAERGSGAFVGDRRLKVAKAPSLAYMSGIPNIRFGEPEFAVHVVRQLKKLGSWIMMRSAAQEYVAVAEGRVDFAYFQRTYPWDHAPGALIVEEAGGVVRRMDNGARYRPGDLDVAAPMMAAPDDERFGWLRDEIFTPKP